MISDRVYPTILTMIIPILMQFVSKPRIIQQNVKSLMRVNPAVFDVIHSDAALQNVH